MSLREDIENLGTIADSIGLLLASVPTLLLIIPAVVIKAVYLDLVVRRR